MTKQFSSSFRGGSKRRTRNLEIPGLRLAAHPEMTKADRSTLIAFVTQLPLVRPIVRLVDGELVQRGLPQMIRQPRRLQVGLALSDAVRERAVKLHPRALPAQQLRQPCPFRCIPAPLQLTL